MDVKKAIEYLYRQMELGRIKNDTEQESYELAIQALGKQIPRKPKENHYEEPGEKPYIKYKCPSCDSKYQITKRFDKHCLDCGQKIDWSE